MSTTSTHNMTGPVGVVDVSSTAARGSSATPTQGTIDANAVQQARQEIQSLLRQIAQLAKSDVPEEEFFKQLLTHTVSALAAEGGAVWMRDPQGQLVLVYQIKLAQTGLQADEHIAALHSQLLASTLTSPETVLIPPGSGSDRADAASNPSEKLLVLSPLCNDAGPQGVLEIFQRPDARPTAQRGFLRFTQQVAELASDYLKAQRLRNFSDKQTLWQQLEQFTRAIHENLDLHETAQAIANESRRIIGCDRVSVATGKGRACQVLAISGQDTLEKRSNVVRRLTRLAGVVAASGESLEYFGDTRNMAPQVERALESYVDLTHAKTVLVLPLVREIEHEQSDSNKQTARRHKQETVGAIVIERIEDSTLTSDLVSRAESIGKHAGLALGNSLEHNDLFLLPVWKAVGKLKWIVRARSLPATLIVTGLVLTLLLALVVVPADFKLEASGQMQPSVQRDLFASINGIITEVPVKHGDSVKAGQLLARLRNTELKIKITDLIGRIDATTEQMRSIERALLGRGLSTEEQTRLSGQVVQLRKTNESLDRQLKLLQSQQEQLQIKSPIDGQIVTWQVRDRLLRRPVRQGQILMTIADPTSPWELEIQMPEDRMGHIAKAAQQSDQPLRVSYFVATEPGQSYQGTVIEIHSVAEVRSEQGNTVLLRVALDEDQPTDLRPGASVAAKVDCGSRSLGYVWFHDVIDFVQSKILFRL